jgi:hypothetical protein
MNVLGTQETTIRRRQSRIPKSSDSASKSKNGVNPLRGNHLHTGGEFQVRSCIEMRLAGIGLPPAWYMTAAILQPGQEGTGSKLDWSVTTLRVLRRGPEGVSRYRDGLSEAQPSSISEFVALRHG